MTYNLDSLITDLGCQITANLLREVQTKTTASDRLLLLEEWDGVQLSYGQYFAATPQAFRERPDVAMLADKVSKLYVDVNHFAKYLLAVAVTPLLKSEFQELLAVKCQ